jgi:hypothetical protein
MGQERTHAVHSSRSATDQKRTATAARRHLPIVPGANECVLSSGCHLATGQSRGSHGQPRAKDDPIQAESYDRLEDDTIDYISL